jgi:hypothetical protein
MKTRLRSAISSLTDYFFFGNFFIAIVAVVMFSYTVRLFGLQVNEYFRPFVFFSTLLSYSLHWYLTPESDNASAKPRWSLSHQRFLFIMLVFSVAGMIISVIPLLGYYKILIPLAAVTFLYSAPKIDAKPFTWLRGKYMAKTISLSVVWLAVTVILPIVVSGNEWNYERALFALNRFMLLFPVCILFDHRDRAEDTLQGIRNIVSLLDEKRMDMLFYACTALAVLTAILLQFKIQSFIDSLYILIPSVLLALTYTKSKNSTSDLWYYTYLDGLMALSGFLYFLVPL